jgi:ATP-dependent DNA helicase PIF1
MGGTVIVLAGDFRQTLPVIPRSTPADELNACLKASYLWRRVQKLTLSMNMRVHLVGDTTSQNFAYLLLNLGDGEFPTNPRTNMISFPPDFCRVLSSVQEIVEKVFPELLNNYKNHKWLCERAILAHRNDSDNRINKQIQNELPGTATTYKSIDTVRDHEQAVQYPTEFLNSLEPDGMPPHNLTLKVGSPIMLLRYLDPPKLCNGTRLCVKKLMPNVTEATVFTGGARGEDVYIPRIPLIPSNMPFDFKRLQYSVLFYCLFVHYVLGLSVRSVDVKISC